MKTSKLYHWSIHRRFEYFILLFFRGSHQYGNFCIRYRLFKYLHSRWNNYDEQEKKLITKMIFSFLPIFNVNYIKLNLHQNKKLLYCLCRSRRGNESPVELFCLKGEYQNDNWYIQWRFRLPNFGHLIS